MIEAFFPTLIYAEKLKDFEHSNDAYIRRLYELKQTIPRHEAWNCDTYASYTKHDLRTESLFASLFSVITTHVNDFAKVYGVDKPNAKMTEAWFNVAQPGNCQEFHMHSSSHFSAVYYVKTPPNCGNIIFKSFEADTDMFRLRTDIEVLAAWKTVFHVPEMTKLVIVRSNLQHMVAKNLSDDDRISIAMNFVIE